MNRHYTAESYRTLIQDARQKMPDITLSSDIIVGFPGETEQDFAQTLALVDEVRFDLLFTFLYSPRSGTPAASYEDPVTPEEKQRRFERLLRVQDEIVAESAGCLSGEAAPSAGGRYGQRPRLSLYRAHGGEPARLRMRRRYPNWGIYPS